VSRLRSPALSHTSTSIAWAVGFGLYILVAGIAIGWTRGVSFVVAGVAGFAIFLFVRFYGEDDPRRP
jgi:hypothetical protein